MIALFVVAIAAWATNGFGLLQPSTPAVIPAQQPNANSNTSDSKSDKTPLESSGSAQTNKEPSKPANSAVSNLPLYAPQGAFVSNHSPGKGGSPTAETSVCNTTPGATCYIIFSNGATTTKLPAKTADSNGTVYWYWDVEDDAHLSAGSWTIKAVATNGTETKTTTDNIPLRVGQ